MRNIALAVVAGSLCLGLVCGNHAYGQAGSLDPSFGVGGQVVTDFGHGVRPLDAALQADGKLVVVGQFYYFIAITAFAIMRYMPDGSLDQGFGDGGSVVIAFTIFDNSANAVAIQSDGKIVVVGQTENPYASVSAFAIARFMDDGTLDASFGTDGQVTTDFLSEHAPGFSEAADVVLLQPDGKILVGGFASPSPRRPSYSALARYNADGTLDETFGDGGKVAVIAIGNISALALLADGQILALNGESIAQFDSDGTLVSPVTSGEIVASAHTGTTDFQLDSEFVHAAAALGPSGRRDIDVKVNRFLAQGQPDPTFNSPAFDYGDPGPFANFAQAIVAGANGQIIVGGLSRLTTGSGYVFGLARINADGSLDTGFGNRGTTTTEFFAADQVLALVMQPDGNIIAIGQTVDRITTRANMALARYLGQ